MKKNQINMFRNACKTSHITLHVPFTDLRLLRGLDAPSRNSLHSALPSPPSCTPGPRSSPSPSASHISAAAPGRQEDGLYRASVRLNSVIILEESYLLLTKSLRVHCGEL